MNRDFKPGDAGLRPRPPAKPVSLDGNAEFLRLIDDLPSSAKRHPLIRMILETPPPTPALVELMRRPD